MAFHEICKIQLIPYMNHMQILALAKYHLDIPPINQRIFFILNKRKRQILNYHSDNTLP